MKDLNHYPKVKDVRKLQHKLEQLEQEKAVHERLIDMTYRPLPGSLKTAAILISSPICEECREFKDRVNCFFELSIEMHEYNAHALSS